MLTTQNINQQFYTKLRDKWREIPATRMGREFSTNMLQYPDNLLLKLWDECKQQTCKYDLRGWYQDLYKNELSGKVVADIGPGIGLDGIFFAEHGARITFVDIVEDNLKLLERICGLKGIKADYYFIDDFFNFKFDKMFDVFMAIGSLHHSPFEYMKKQLAEMTKFLKVGGKVLMFAYPKERYVISGARNFEEFGHITDGVRTPWAEWYDDEKIKALFGPDYKLNWSRNFGKDEKEFNWFDLTKQSGPEKFSLDAGKKPNNQGIPIIGYRQNTANEISSHQNELHPVQTPDSCRLNVPIQSLRSDRLHTQLNFQEQFVPADSTVNKPLDHFKLDLDDSQILRYIFRNFRPDRHLEFGTWQGKSTTYCLEECDASVWTINIFEGMKDESGERVYGLSWPDAEELENWAKRIGMPIDTINCRTDSIGFVGRMYLEKGFGNRVCQIYSDSRQWDTSKYPPGFFDSVFIDGGHVKDVIVSDTLKSLELLRSGGVMIWHDFCPPVMDKLDNINEAMRAVETMWDKLSGQMEKISWVNPSWLLIGVKK